MIAEYIRDKNGNKRGLVIAMPRDEDSRIGIGWSLCNKKDNFDRNRAWEIATGRALAGSEHKIGNLPCGVFDSVDKMFSRAFKYFHVNPENIVVATLP